MDRPTYRRSAIALLALFLIPGVGAAQEPSVLAGGDPATAAHTISTVATDSTTTTVELMESAREMFIADRYDLAEMLYKSVLVREPDNVEAMQELAIIYEAIGRLQYARGLLSRALIIRPGDPEIIRRHGEIAHKLSTALEAEIDSLIHAGLYEQAIPKLAILLTTQPENAELYYKKADCHLKLGNPEAALVEIERAQSIRRDGRFDHLKTTASAAKNKNEIDRLTEQARRGLEKNTRQGNEEALQALGRILEIDPGNAWAKKEFVRRKRNERQDGDGWQWNTSEHLAAWWGAAKPYLAKAGDVVLELLASLRTHLDVLMTILLGLIIFASPLTRMLVQGFSPRQSLAGRLEHFRLQELLTMINTHRHTGALVLRTRATRGKIYFDKGEIYHCKAGKKKGRTAVQNLLKDAHRGYFVFKFGATSTERTTETPLSLMLLGLPEREDSVTSQSILAKQKQQSRMSALLNKDN